MENASKHFEMSSVVLHLYFSLTQGQEPSPYSTTEHSCYPSAMKGALRLADSSWTSTRQTSTHRWASQELQPWQKHSQTRCLFDYRTLITKLIKKLREIVWHLIWVGICRHSSAIFKGLIIYLEPCKPKELPLNLYNPVWKGLWICNSHTCQKVAKKLELPLCLSSLSGQHKLGPVSEGENHHENYHHTQVTIGSLKKKKPTNKPTNPWFFSRAEIALI